VEDCCKCGQEQSGSTHCGGILRKDPVCGTSHFYFTNNEILDLATNYFNIQVIQYYNILKMCMSHSQQNHVGNTCDLWFHRSALRVLGKNLCKCYTTQVHKISKKYGSHLKILGTLGVT